jgi:hypothetical protein
MHVYEASIPPTAFSKRLVKLGLSNANAEQAATTLLIRDRGLGPIGQGQPRAGAHPLGIMRKLRKVR